MTDVTSNVTISLDGRSVEAKSGELLIEAAEGAGVYIPRYCYHPRMEPVGMCRMCLVDVEGPRGATLQPACFIKVAEGMSVVTDSEKVKKAQDGVMDFLLANHPLDCPVCDKGGECPLQDQSYSHGSGETRFIEEKRHWAKPIQIGEVVLLDRERCIQCARCTRFSAEVSGDNEIAFVARGERIEVAPAPGVPFNSVFSGNTIQICPVGALTAKPYRFKARPWDLDQVESTCTTCALGCRVAVQSSGNRLTRVLGVDSEPVNHGWLCDKGRFTLDSIDGNPDEHDVLSAVTRVREPMVRRDGELVAVSWSEALHEAATLLLDASRSPGGVGVIGGAALTNEGAFAWERFVRGVLRSEHVDAQYDDGLDGALLQALPRATIDEAANARVVVTITGDIREELPVLFLRLRENFVRRSNALVEFAFAPSALREFATVALPVRPGEAHYVAQALCGSDAVLPRDSAITTAEIEASRALLGELGEGVVFIVGRPNMAESSVVIESAIRRLAERFPAATFLTALRRANVVGALDMGLGPSLRPGRGYAHDAGRTTSEQMRAMRAGEQRAVVLLGGCLLGNVVDVEGARAALAAAKVVAVTGHGDATLAYADVVLPAAVQHERVGTVTNIEGRVSALVPKIVAPGSAWPDVAIAAELAESCGQSLGLTSVEQTARVIQETTGYPALRALRDARVEGVLVGEAGPGHARRPLDPMAFPGIAPIEIVGLAESAGATSLGDAPSATPPAGATLDEAVAGRGVEVAHYDAYALALNLSRRLYDHGVAMQGSPALANLVARSTVLMHHADMDRLGLVTGDSVRVSGPQDVVTLPVELNDQVPRGTVNVAFGSVDERGDGAGVLSLVDVAGVVSEVRVETA